jgi:hypothetical protein
MHAGDAVKVMIRERTRELKRDIHLRHRDSE